MTTFLAAIIIATAFIVGVGQIVTEIRATREDTRRSRTLSILALFGPAIAAVQEDPKALLVWQPLAAATRRLFPEECASLDTAAGSAFPFGAEIISSAHARWTTDGRARLDALEREKLDLYQRRYEEYVRVAKALQKLAS